MRRASLRDRRRSVEAGELAGFPVTPMLDMAFQLLAFFILAFRAPSREARIDLYLPTAAVALPADDETGSSDPNADLYIRAKADDSGKLLSLTINDRPLLGPAELEEALRKLIRVSRRGGLTRVALVADDGLRYENAARLMGACAAAGVPSVRLATPPREGQAR